MIDRLDNDATHGDEGFVDVSDRARLLARKQYLEALKRIDFDGREIAIDTLIQSDGFWNAVFLIGAADANGTMDDSAMLAGAAHINAAVELSIQTEIDDLARVY